MHEGAGTRQYNNDVQQPLPSRISKETSSFLQGDALMGFEVALSPCKCNSSSMADSVMVPMVGLASLRQQAGASPAMIPAVFAAELLKDKKLSRRLQQEVHDSFQGITSNWVDLVSSHTARYQPPISQTTQRVRTPKPAAKNSSLSSPPVFRPSIRLQQQILAAQEQDQQQHQQQQCTQRSGKPGFNREAEKDRLAAVFALGREGAAALQQASLIRTQAAAAAAAAAAVKQNHAAPMQEQLIDQVIEELNARTELLQELQQQRGAAAAEQCRLVKAEVQQRVVELRRLGVTAGKR